MKSVAVIIACYTLDRFDLLIRSIESVRAQSAPPRRVIVVVDHNDALEARLSQVAPQGVEIFSNTSGKGAGNARNVAALSVDTDYVAFLDDDAEADRDWLRHLLSTVDHERAVGTGGRLLPVWPGGGKPSWFPAEFSWVVGGSNPGWPGSGHTVVRNVWASNMLVERRAFVEAGGFRADFGKIGNASQPEDTELCLRLTRLTGRPWIGNPDAIVHHHVADERTAFRYFAKRCWFEGRGKAALSALPGADSASLSDERQYLRSTIPRALATGLRKGMLGNMASLGSSSALVAGVVITSSSFVLGATRSRMKVHA